MLEDQRYIGTYVIGKRKVQEIGSRRMKLKDESEWFKIPDHHPAIVSMELFEKANASIRRFSLPNKKRRDYLLRELPIFALFSITETTFKYYISANHLLPVSYSSLYLFLLIHHM